jgi:hypothetical protein
MQGLVRERKALAAAVLSFYMTIYGLVALQAPEGWSAAFAALAAVYGGAFVALVAGYFWGRWFAIGIGISGLISAAMSIWQIGPEPVLVIYGATHAATSLLLWGAGMAGLFDGRKEWRDRYHLDDNATHRLGKSIIRVGVSLPYIVLYALAPREASSVAALAVLGLAGAGLWGLIRMRTWGVLSLMAGAGVAAVSVVATAVDSAAPLACCAQSTGLGVLAAVLLAAGAAPFAAPAVRFLRGRVDRG